VIARIQHNGEDFRVDLGQPIDLSIPLHAAEDQLRAWYVDPVRMEPVVAGEHSYAVASGAAVNFRNVYFNPHGHGTHTEGVGHIAKVVYPIGNALGHYFFTAHLYSVDPVQVGTDHVLTLDLLRSAWRGTSEAVVLRTQEPAALAKRDWCHTNPPYLQAEACAWLRHQGVQHLLLDLPSVDRENDGGALAAHRAFWNFPAELDFSRTITELVRVPRDAKDGRYLLELQFPHFMNDAAPSRPLLYALLP
jgi:arylformamidase